MKQTTDILHKELILLLLFLGLSTLAQAQIPVYVACDWKEGTSLETLKAELHQYHRQGVRGVCLNAGNDLSRIAQAAQAAHAEQLEYQALVPTLRRKGLNPKWYAVNRLGQPALSHPAYTAGNTLLDPLNPEVHRYLTAYFSKVAQLHDVDYVMLADAQYTEVIPAEGLRKEYGLIATGEYAPADYCYCDDCVRIFQDKTGMDIRQVTDPSKVKAWRQFRCDALTSLVNDIAAAVHGAGKKISAAVLPGPQSYARHRARQEWQKWNLDAVFPMNFNNLYSRKTAWLRFIVDQETNSLKGSDMKVVSGLYICPDEARRIRTGKAEDAGLSAANLATAIALSVQSGADGIALFSADRMTAEHWKALTAAISVASTKVSQRRLSAQESEQMQKLIANDFKADITARTKYIYDKHIIKIGRRTMELHWNIFGQKPKDGRSLYISLHGGGGTLHELNIQQWTNQWRLYTPSEGVYLCPHAPVDAWNMWCQPDLDQFYHDIILMAVSWLDVNPNKVYILGYSAGGAGVWRMAPRMADTWAAASMMAGHPSDVSLVNLRNTPFMIWCGANDAAYNRNLLARQRIEQMNSLQRLDPEGYRHEGHIVEGCGHWMNRADTAAISWMEKFTRNPYPHKIVWQQEEVLRPSFYWITAPLKELERYKQVRLHVEGNSIIIDRCDYSSLQLGLNDSIVDLNKPVKIVYKGRTLWQGKAPRTAYNLFKTLRQREDTSYSFPAVVTIKLRP